MMRSWVSGWRTAIGMEHEGCPRPLCSDPINHLLSVRQAVLCKLLWCEYMCPGVKELHDLHS